MMPSASPKQRVLIVGAKLRNVPECLYAAPGGLELVGLLAQGSARSRELAHAFGIPLYTSPEQITRMPDIACIVVRSTVAGGTGTQLARHFLRAAYTSFRSIPSTRMTSVPYKRWRRNRAAAIG
ncbi:Thiazolinyl-S-HMWP1 reductase YbtU [Escherichia coli]|nr:Thiazolinyl-S-HMWP1 reductase YbtU [Escherichia coli]